HDAVTWHDLIVHAEVAAAVGDELVDLLEAARIEQQIDPLARRELARFALLPEALFPSAELRAALDIGQQFGAVHRETLTPWAFSQSCRNLASPISVSGCLNSCSITAAGTVTTSAPIRAASMT